MRGHGSLWRRFDETTAVVGVGIALAMLPLRLLTDQVYVTTIPLVLGVACLLYLVTVRNTASERPLFGSRLAAFLPSLTLLGLSGLVVVASLQARSLLFHYLAIWVGVVLFAQIFFVADADFRPHLLVGLVVLFGGVLRFAALSTTPGFIGIDIWTHFANWTPAVASAHSLAPLNESKYYASPFVHLLVVAGSQLMGVSIRHALFLTLGVAMPLSALLVYTTTNVLVDTRWAVFAAAAFTVAGDVVEWGLALHPTSLGLLFFLGVLFALTRVLDGMDEFRDYLLVVCFSVSVILTHQISAFVMLVLVGSGLLAKVVYGLGVLSVDRELPIPGDGGHAVNLTGLLVFDLGFITFMWSLTPYRRSTFLQTMVSFFVNTVESSAGFLNLAGGAGGGATGGTTSSFVATLVTYVDSAVLLALLFVTILGSLRLLRDRVAPHAPLTLVVASAVMLVFVFGLPLFGIRTFVPGRWVPFVMAPMAVLGAVGFAHLTDEARGTVALVVLVVFAVAFPAVSLLSSEAVQDDPVFDSTQTRYSYSERELAAMRTFDERLPNVTESEVAPERELHTDHPYETMIERSGAYPADIALVSDGRTSNETYVYREYQGSGGAYFQTEGGTAGQRAVGPEVCTGRDRTYDNGDVRLCVA